MNYEPIRYNIPVLNELFKTGYIENSKREVIAATLRYIMREATFSEAFKGVVSPVHQPEIRKQVCSFDVCVLLKLSVLECSKIGASFSKAVSIFVKNGLSSKDVWAWMVAKEIDLLKAQKWLDEGGVIPTPKEVHDKSYEIIYTGTVDRVIRSTVRAKLWFITSSQPIELCDLESEVRASAMESYITTIPFLVDAHIKPSIVRSAQNYVSKIIKYYTYAKRSRMIQINGKFVHTTQSLDAKADDEASGSDSLDRYWYAKLDTSSAIQKDNFEKFHSLNSLVHRVKCEKAKKAIQLFASCSSCEVAVKEGSTPYYKVAKRFLNIQAAKTGQIYENIISFLDDVGERRFLSSVRQFVGLSTKQWLRFTDWMKNSLVNDRESLAEFYAV